MVAHINYERQVNIDAGKGLGWARLAEDIDDISKVYHEALAASSAIQASPVYPKILTNPIREEAIKYGKQTTCSAPPI